MKRKVLFSAVLTAVTVITSAQSVVLPNEANDLKQINSEKRFSSQQVETNGIKTPFYPISDMANYASTRANGVSCNRPIGTFWGAMEQQTGGLTKISRLHVPAWKEVTYVNTSNTPSDTKWTVNGGDASQFVENNNFHFIYGLGIYYPPTIQNKSGNISFTIGASDTDESVVITEGSAETTLSGVRIPNTLRTHNGENGPYLFGSNADNNGTIMGILANIYEKPVVPLCVSNIFFPIISDSQIPLAEGVKMTLEIRNAVSNENGVLLPGNEVLYTMVAEKGDISDATIFGNQGPKTYMLNFSNKVYDPWTNTMIDEPFMLNEAFALTLSGFDQAGVDIGIIAANLQEGDNDYSYMVFPNEPTKYYSYAKLNALANITGFFNVISLPKETTILKAPDAGGRAYTEDGIYDFAGVYTTLDWSEENFWYDSEIPEWIRVSIDDSERKEGGYYRLIFECDPLPAGETSRHWTFNIQSFGSIADYPITVYQGIKPSGIDKTDANNEVKIVSTSDAYILSYPVNVTNVSIVNVAGQTIATYELPAGGQFTVPAAELSRGLYLLKFNNNQTVKVIK